MTRRCISCGRELDSSRPNRTRCSGCYRRDRQAALPPPPQILATCDLGLTQYEVAKVLGLSRQRVQQIEHGALVKVRRRLLSMGIDDTCLDGLVHRQQGGVFD